MQKFAHWVLALGLASPLLLAQNFVYTNDSLDANAVSGFSVDAAGKLTVVSGSPFATGGKAGGVTLGTFSANRIVSTSAGNHLFVSNDSDGSITAFGINTATGALTRIGASPFATTLGACNAGFSLAISPDGTRLIAGSLCSASLQNIQINADGSLASLGSSQLAGCAASTGRTSSLRYTPDGKFVAVADAACSSVEVFRATTTALLQAVPGSPFVQNRSAAPVSSLDVSCSNSFLYAAGTPSNGSGTVDAFTMSSTGALAEISGGILTGRSTDLQSTVLTPDGRFLVTSGWDSTRFTVYSVGTTDGKLTEIGGSPFGFGDISPAQIGVSADGKFIYYAENTDDPSYTPGVGVLAINAGGTLTQVSGSPFRNPKASFNGGNNSLTAFPPKGCSTGGGVTQGPAVSLSNNSFSFLTATGTTSAAQSVDVTNTGDAPLIISNIQLNGAGFNYTGTCSNATLQPQQTCNIRITYTASSGVPVSGSLVITDNAPSGKQTITLTGASTSPALSISPASLTISSTLGVKSAPQALTLSSVGGSALTITNIQANPNGAVSLDFGSCLNGSISSGSTCTVNVSYTPATATTVQASLVITSNATPAQQTVALTLIGTAALAPVLSVSPTSITFGATVVGTSSPKRNITITNSGTGSLSVQSLTISNAPVYSVFAAECPAQLAAGASCNASVNFHPTAGGAAPSATVTFNSNAATSPSVTLGGTGILKNQCNDADGDGLCDDWETNGVTIRTSTGDNFIDLPKMGANPNHKDIFIQADWMAGSGPGSHSHQPNVSAMRDIVAAFANSPVHNLDNVDGIAVHIDCGPTCPMSPGASWGTLSLASSSTETQYLYSAPPPPNAPKPLPLPDTWVLFDKLSANFVNSGRALIFHHAIFAHYQNSSTTSSGLSGNGSNFELGSSKVMVTLGGTSTQVGSEREQAGTLMHELGHNLALHHGGNDDDNYKPNYLSVMNYSFQFNGLTKDGDDGLFDYSRFTLGALDETSLNETAGLRAGSEFPNYGTKWFCKSATLQPTGTPSKTLESAKGSIDWNCDGHFTTGVSEDINGDQTVANGAYSGGRLIKTLAASQFDWTKLVFTGGALAGQGVGVDEPTDNPISEITPEQAYQMQPFTGVKLTYPNTLTLAPGTSVNMAVVITNFGSKADTFSFTSNAPAGWLDASTLPGSLDLQPGASATVRVAVTAPQSAAIGTAQMLSLTAQSKNHERSNDAAQFYVVAGASGDPLIASVSDLLLPSQGIGTKGSPTPLTLTNGSGSALSIASLNVTGEFTQTNDCGNTLAAGASCLVQVTFAPANAGTRTGMLTITTSAAGAPLVINLHGTAGDVIPGPSLAASVNAASGQTGSLAAGTLFSIYGTQLADGIDQATALPLPTQLAGASVTIGGVPAPLLYASPGQINAQIPYGLPNGPLAVIVNTGSGPIAQSSIQIAAATPGLFLLYGTKHLAAQNVDYSLNETAHPAPSGGIVVVYFTGQGAVDQAVTSGTGAPTAVPANVSAPVTATIGGFPAKVLFAGLTPGTVGLAQANLMVPTTADGKPLAAGDYDVILTVGGVATPAGSISVGK